jgi:NAD(P)-dependent dehydrogenase (short-subunit alcohol dehydrogenase family)
METAIIAAVGPGLGASLAHAFASQGYRVALLSRSLRQAPALLEEIRPAHGKALVVQTDVTPLRVGKKAVEQVRSELGQITALAYNASGYRGGFLELAPKTIQQSFEVGVMGAISQSKDHSGYAERRPRLHLTDRRHCRAAEACGFRAAGNC